MKDQVLVKVCVVTDDETGNSTVGDMDFGIPGTTYNWLKLPGNREKLSTWMQWLTDAVKNKTTPFEDME